DLLAQQVAIIGSITSALREVVTVVVNDSPAVTVGLIAGEGDGAQAHVPELPTLVEALLVIEGRIGAKLFLLQAPECRVLKIVGIGPLDTLAQVTGETTDPACDVVVVIHCMSRRIGLRKRVACSIVSR